MLPTVHKDQYQSLTELLSLLDIDDHNDQNHNAGNGGDLIKHTVYLTLLETLLEREPWRSEIRLRECHAGQRLQRSAPVFEDGRSIRRECDVDMEIPFCHEGCASRA